MFHDAVEGFLLMAGEHLGAPSVREFEKYWPTLDPAKLPGGVQLPMQQSMARLNKARVGIKHLGNHPSRESIEQYAKDTAAFLAAASQLVFGVDYGSVTMASVIPQDKVRALAEAADAASAAGDQIRAMVHLVDAWSELFHQRHDALTDWEDSPFRFGPTIHTRLRDYEIAAYLWNEDQSRRHPRRNEDIGRQLAQVTEAVKELQAAARVIAIGVDFAEYQRFKNLTPSVVDYFGGRREYLAPAGYAPTTDDVAFCLQFVVTSALRLARADAQVAAPPWLDGQNPWHMRWETVFDVPGRGS